MKKWFRKLSGKTYKSNPSDNAAKAGVGSTKKLTEIPDLLTDSDVLTMIGKYEDWAAENGISQDSGLWQIINFLRVAIENGPSLAQLLLERQRLKSTELANDARANTDLPSDVKIAIDYLAKRLQSDPQGMDRDAAFIFCEMYARRNLSGSSDKHIVYLYARLNSIFNIGKGVNFWVVIKGAAGEIDESQIEIDESQIEKAVKALEIPVVTEVLFSAFPLGLYIDSMQFGHNVWGPTEDVVRQIEGHVHDSRSHGQRCSLYHSEVADPADWRASPWFTDPRYVEVTDTEDWWLDPIPDWVRENM